jgi:hypothetical protein
LQAVEEAIENAKKALIHDHVSHCVDRSLKAAGRAALHEFKLAARYPRYQFCSIIMVVLDHMISRSAAP